MSCNLYMIISDYLNDLLLLNLLLLKLMVNSNEYIKSELSMQYHFT